MRLLGWLARLFALVGFGYLGLYVYGVATGAFSPTQMILFSALAAFFAIANLVHVIRATRDLRTVGGRQVAMPDVHTLRERRGF